MKYVIRIVPTLLLLCAASWANSQTTVIRNIHLITGSENRVIRDAQVVVQGRIIQQIGKTGDPIPSGATVIDGQGYYLMPGLIDCHTHIDNLAAAQRALHSGVTTYRTAGVSAFQDVALGELSRTGKIAGPDVIAAGTFVTPQLGETILGDLRYSELIGGVQTDEELRKIVRINIERGAKVIKTRGTERAGLPETDPRKQVYTEHQLRVIVEEAALKGIPVMVHAHGDEGARAAVLAGARSIEHGTFLSDETLQLMKERGTFLVLTYITLEDLTKPGGDYSNPTLELRGRYMMPIGEKVFRKALSLGVKIATGADNDYAPHSTSRIALECEHYVRMGMTPFQAIQSATTVAADLLMVATTTGRIQSGLEADMILLPGNPLEDIRVLQDVLMVVSNGQIALLRIPFGKEQK
ncbi:MAG: amidohydrolase family protein [Cyclobacteriaceae bacterium]|nr:amidohydrolase family protein [Cyclobacteriaceae bacterium]